MGGGYDRGCEDTISGVEDLTFHRSTIYHGVISGVLRGCKNLQRFTYNSSQTLEENSGYRRRGNAAGHIIAAVFAHTSSSLVYLELSSPDSACWCDDGTDATRDGLRGLKLLRELKIDSHIFLHGHDDYMLPISYDKCGIRKVKTPRFVDILPVSIETVTLFNDMTKELFSPISALAKLNVRPDSSAFIA